MEHNSFLYEDAVSSVQEIITVFDRLGISPCYAYQTLNQLSTFFNSRFESLNQEQKDFLATYCNNALNQPSKVPFRVELEQANFFIPDDAYIRLSSAFSCIVDYFSSISSEYSEKQARELIQGVKDMFLLKMQKENKGLSLVYLARR